MDGNRKYAVKKKLFPKFKGHIEGKKTLERLLNYWAKLKEPRYLTIYTFSLFNLKNRNPLEKKFIYKLLEIGFNQLLKRKDVYENNIHISFIGKKEGCPKSLQNSMKIVEEKTKTHKNKFLTFAICYDGQEEILQAFNKMIEEKVKKANLRTIKKHIYTKNLPAVDLMIRTGGEKRISGFLLWDISYAELIFRKQTWPEYTPKMFENDLKEFRRRERKFGK